MAIYKANNQIGKVYKGSNQIGKVYKGNVLIYTAEETFSKSIQNTYNKNGGHFTFDAQGNPTGWVADSDNYSEYSVGSVDIPIGETFRIDTLYLTETTPPSGTGTEVVLLVNGVEVVHRGYGGGETVSLGSYPSATGIYTSNRATNTIQFKLRGKVSASQYDYNPVRTLILQYTIGV